MDSKKIGVYVHWPFCARLCPYCDFNIYKDKPEMATDLTRAILADLETWREASGPRELVSLHFGGGTPSLMSAGDMGSVIEQATSLWSASSDIEIALEANPGDVSQDALTEWHSAGIERVSIGVQSFDDDVLNFLGRNHDSATATQAIRLATKIMPRVSIDLIYGWVGQTQDHWQGELTKAIKLETGHISAYQLTIEEKTAFARAERRGEARAVDVDTSADLFEQVGDILGDAGYNRYEVSNFAKSKADQSRHNTLYWHGEDYVGVGPGAHGRLTRDGDRLATVTTLKPADYIREGASFCSPLTAREPMSREACVEEYVLMGLRVSEGISLSTYEHMSGSSLSTTRIQELVADGLLRHEGDRLMATDQGRLVLDAVSHALLAGR